MNSTNPFARVSLVFLAFVAASLLLAFEGCPITFKPIIPWKENDPDKPFFLEEGYYTEEPEQEDAPGGDDSGSDEVPGFHADVGSPTASMPCTPSNVQVIGGQVNKMPNPPELMLWANAEAYPPPAGFSITYSPNTYPVNEKWRAMSFPGDWVEATTTLAVTRAGIQFMADDNIRSARVLVNGAEIWRGNLHDLWNDGTDWASYIQFDCEPAGWVTIRAEMIEPWVPVLLFGFELP